MAMNVLRLGLSDANQHADALIVGEAELSTLRRIGASEDSMLVVQANLANSYQLLGRHEEAISMRRDVYSGRLEVHGEEHPETLRAANNYALSLITRKHFEEARSLLRKMVPVARRVLGEANDLTLKMRWLSARALYQSRRRHARRSPRGRDDRRGHSSDRAARSRWRAPAHNGI